ncbi:nucleoside deaminase [Deinococcus radiomollis]|uniref:nucleoside deaminase n=1 Tax=Deinococcus radiomollis TaxID=468916 RepID=UPI003892882B
MTLPAPWRAALEEAWTAYTEDSLPIGACVADASGTVLARGRNRLGEARKVDGVIGGHDLGHAEINALLALKGTPRPDCYGWTVYTTVEPCPQCAGAVTMSGVRGLSYAAPDPWAGCADLLTTHPYMVRKGMLVGRAPADIVRVSLLLMLHGLWGDGRRPGADVLIDSFAAQHPAEVERAGQLLEAGTLLNLRARRAGLDEVLATLN